MDLGAVVPGVRCRPGCTDCCGPVPWSRREAEELLAYLKRQGRELPREPRGLECAFEEPLVGCSVYPVRPLMCRLFGAMEGLDCPHGCGCLGRLSEAGGRVLIDRYVQEMEGPPVFFVGDEGRRVLAEEGLERLVPGVGRVR